MNPKDHIDLIRMHADSLLGIYKNAKGRKGSEIKTHIWGILDQCLFTEELMSEVTIEQCNKDDPKGGTAGQGVSPEIPGGLW